LRFNKFDAIELSSLLVIPVMKLRLPLSDPSHDEKRWERYGRTHTFVKRMGGRSGSGMNLMVRCEKISITNYL
jgi:hypothetical protein